MTAGIEVIVFQVLRNLVAGDFDSLERLTGGRRLSSTELRDATNAYRYVLTMPPDSELPKLINIVKIDDKAQSRHSVWINLWTEEEGRSDLQLRLTIVKQTDGSDSVEIDDLRVP